jgi:predicted nucleic acid-binding protein
MYVVDASVLIADLQPLEPHHAEARGALALLSRNNVRVYCPTIVLSEIAAGIRRATGHVHLAEQAFADTRQRDRFYFVAVDDSLIDRAAVIAARQQVRGCDAIYIALAEDLGAPLITLDDQQKVRVPLGVVTYSPADVLNRNFRLKR